MKKITLFCSSFFVFQLFLIAPFGAFAQSWDWGANGNSMYTNDFGSPVATDKNGNVYITGDYIDSVTFGSQRLTCHLQNSYLVKYDSAGNILWAVQPIEASSSSYDDAYAASMATDEAGNVYIAGGFYGTIVFGSYVLSDGSNGSVFLAKYSPSGNVIWARQGMSTTGGIISSLAIDKSGNVIMTGSFQGSTIVFGTDSIITSGLGSVMFIAKYDSSGNFLWVKQAKIRSVYGSSSGGYLALDKTGNAYVAGTFEDTISFGPDSVSTSGLSAFLVKYSASGNISWVKQSENISLNGLAEGIAATTDETNNIYITGSFNAEVKFENVTLYSPSTYSVFLTKYDTNGHVLWAKQSSPGWEGSALKSDKQNNIYLGGVSYLNNDTLRFGNYTLTTGPWVSYASFLMKFDTTGNPICGSMLENLGYSGGAEIACDSSGKYIYMTGTFENDTVICGSNTLISTGGNENCFVGRWLNCSVVTGINNFSSVNSSVSMFPNPGNGLFQLEIRNYELKINCNMEIYNVLGEKVLNETLHYVQGNNSIDMENQPGGVYIYRVTEENGNIIGTGKFIIQK